MEIINLLTQIDDIEKLRAIFENISSLEKPKLVDGAVEIRKGISYEDILKEQDYAPISYEEFRTEADKVEWEHSLEELLAAAD